MRTDMTAELPAASIRRRWTPTRASIGMLVAALACLSALPERARARAAVGSFTKSTAGAPVSQVVPHGLGATPRALLLWTNGKTNQSFSTSFHFGIGVSDGTTDRSAAAASQNGQATTDASRRLADKAITIVQWGETVLAEADLTAWDEDDFTLNWTTNDATASVIHFVVIGGRKAEAKVLDWTTNTATGNQSVTGVGFEPEVVLHLSVGDYTGAIPGTGPHAGMSIGAMDAAGNVWASGVFIEDAVIPSDTQRSQQTNACVHHFADDLSVTKKASWVSMDSDGFTLNFSVANGSAHRVLSLALRGIKAHVGSFDKTIAAAPVAQSVTGVGFGPQSVFFTSFQRHAATNVTNHARFGVGAADHDSGESSTFQDANAKWLTGVDGIDKTSKAIVLVNNNQPSINAEADLTSLDGDGFTLNWTTNNTQAIEVLYVALGTSRRVLKVQ